MVTINWSRKRYLCERSRVWLLLIGIQGVQSGAVNARSTLGQTLYASMHTNSISKHAAEWNHFTQTHGVWTQVYGNMYCIWRPPSENICIYLILLQTTIIGLHFAAYNIALSSWKFFRWSHTCCLFLPKWPCSCARSSKVIDVGTIRKCVYDFLLVRNTNIGPILHLFGDFAHFLLLTPSLSHPHFGGVFVAAERTFCGQCEHVPKVIGREVTSEVLQHYSITISERHRQTQGRTDGRTS